MGGRVGLIPGRKRRRWRQVGVPAAIRGSKDHTDRRGTRGPRSENRAVRIGIAPSAVKMVTARSVRRRRAHRERHATVPARGVSGNDRGRGVDTSRQRIRIRWPAYRRRRDEIAILCRPASAVDRRTKTRRSIGGATRSRSRLGVAIGAVASARARTLVRACSGRADVVPRRSRRSRSLSATSADRARRVRWPAPPTERPAGRSQAQRRRQAGVACSEWYALPRPAPTRG